MKHVLNTDALPYVGVGEFGYVYYENEDLVVLYDDDLAFCSCPAEEDCDFDWDAHAARGGDPFDEACECGTTTCRREGRKHRKHYQDAAAICLDPMDLSRTRVLPYLGLRAMPDPYAFQIIPPTATGQGILYAVASQPDLSLHRLKLGWTSNWAARIKAYRTLCPRALLLSAWALPANMEKNLLFLGGRSGYRCKESEEFDFRDPWAFLNEVAEHFLTPAYDVNTESGRRIVHDAQDVWKAEAVEQRFRTTEEHAATRQRLRRVLACAVVECGPLKEPETA